MSATPEHESAPHTSRRAVLRAGAHAAWAVPAIQIAATAPAYAVSGTQPAEPTVTTQAVLGVTGRFTPGSWPATTAALTVTNAVGHAAATALVVVVTGAGLSYVSSPTRVTAGWSVTRTSTSFTFTYAGKLASGSSVPLSFSAYGFGQLNTSAFPWKWVYPVSISVSGTNVAPPTGPAKPASLSTTSR